MKRVRHGSPCPPVLRPLPMLGLLAALLAGTGTGALVAGAGAPVRFARSSMGSKREGRVTASLPRSASRSRPHPVAPPAGRISLVWTGEQDGHLEPCGCAKPQLGGMVRRAGYLRVAGTSGPSLRLDNGDLTEARGRQDQLKAETSIQLLNQLSYAAINLGETEFQLGLPYLQYLASSFKGALLCANARDAEDRPVFREYVTREVRAGGRTVKVAVVGLLSERYAPEAESLNPGLKIASAGDTLDRLRPSLDGQGPVILLFHGEPEEARQLVSGQDWITAVIAAHAPDDHPRDLARRGEPHLLTVGRDGKYLGVAEIVPPRGAAGRAVLSGVRAVALGPDTPEDPAARAIESVYLKRVADEGLLDKLPRLTVPNSDHFAGTSTCKSCHASASHTWAASDHSHAWATLVHVGHDRDPDCVGCHTVGLEFHGGFESATKTPQFENVGCESCHHAAGLHAAFPASVKPPRVGSAACAACHTPDQSPGFDFAKFWPKIRH